MNSKLSNRLLKCDLYFDDETPNEMTFLNWLKIKDTYKYPDLTISVRMSDHLSVESRFLTKIELEFFESEELTLEFGFSI